MVKLELYRVFYTVAKCGSLTRAAEELFISQPAVSQAIKQLESQFGVSLFNRTHRGMELSVHGKMVFRQVEEALALLDDAENKLLELKTTATGMIRIGATDAIFYIFFRIINRNNDGNLIINHTFIQIEYAPYHFTILIISFIISG